MRKVLLVLPALAVALAAVFASSGQSAQAAATIKVKAGDGAPGYAVNLFGPSTVYVAPGDTVNFTFPWYEPHSVTFGQPTGDPSVLVGGANPSYEGGFISSGLVVGGPSSTESYSVTFPKSGSYPYFCILHPFMTGTVVVRTADLGPADTQASADSRANADLGSALASLKAVAAGMAAKPVAVSANGSGGRKYTLSVSSATDQREGDVQQFFPANVNIGVNDSVEWVSGVQTPHTVSIGNPGEIAALIPPGGLEAVLDIAKKVPAGGKFDGTGIVNSGVIGVGYPLGTKFELTFSKAGTYDYYCFLHADQGMVAKVTVGAPLPPNTGNAIETANESGTSGLLIVFGAIAVSLLATTTAFAASRR